MSYNSNQFRKIVRQVVKEIGLWSPVAEEMLMGTAAVEMNFGHYLVQLGGGPGCGVFSIEKNTEIDVWNNYIRYHPEMREHIARIAGVTGPNPLALTTDLAYQIIICRLKYRMIRAHFPALDDLPGQAKYWDRYYNCNPEKGTTAEYIDKYRRYVVPVIDWSAVS